MTSNSSSFPYLDCDIRVKENIEDYDLNNSYSIIKNITMRKFNYCQCYQNYCPTGTFGIMAQELKTICPNLVEENHRIFDKDDGTEVEIPDFNVINTQLLHLHLIATVKSLLEKVETLESKIQTLESEIETLKQNV
jgi:hypothetical protein